MVMYMGTSILLCIPLASSYVSENKWASIWIDRCDALGTYLCHWLDVKIFECLKGMHHRAFFVDAGNWHILTGLGPYNNIIMYTS